MGFLAGFLLDLSSLAGANVHIDGFKTRGFLAVGLVGGLVGDLIGLGEIR